MTRDTMPPEIEAAIADAGQALVDAWDSAQDGPPHRFVVFVDPEGDPEVAAGWMAMARMHAATITALLAEIARLRALGLEACDALIGAGNGLESRSDTAARRTWAKDAYATAERIRKELTRG